MTASSAVRTLRVEAWGGRLELQFQVAGSGPALVYLHPAGGLVWDDLLQRLSDRFTVFAPILPGTDPADTMSIPQVDDVFDLVLAYEGAVRSLGLQGAPVIGASFGGMLAAELAACFPDLFSPMILLAPQACGRSRHPGKSISVRRNDSRVCSSSTPMPQRRKRCWRRTAWTRW